MSHAGQSQLKNHDDLSTLDRLGMILSALCLVHCLATPVLILSLPLMARYYLLHPYFHWILAMVIVPLGLIAFGRGFRHHRKSAVWVLGIPGLFLVGIVPLLLHSFGLWVSLEPAFVTAGSVLVVLAHWKNLTACSTCPAHSH